ncbi:hypothetical protein K3495_g14691 [Podosphaera aphanis]|nr:hypothetical protein K3495_g14691 [Podosphaera aphanis]
MEDKANRRRAPAIMYRVGDKVWLNLKNIPTPQPKKKLAWVNAKYNVTRVILPHVVELDVPSKIWPRLHVDLLRKASEDPLPSQLQDNQQPEPIMDEQSPQAPPEQIVERILRAEKHQRGRGWVRRVLVKWKNFAEPTWEDRSELDDVRALDVFESKYGKGDGVGEEEGARQGRKKRQVNDSRQGDISPVRRRCRRGRGSNVRGCARVGVSCENYPGSARTEEDYLTPDMSTEKGGGWEYRAEVTGEDQPGNGKPPAARVMERRASDALAQLAMCIIGGGYSSTRFPPHKDKD